MATIAKHNEQKIWESMLQRSFSPSEWFVADHSHEEACEERKTSATAQPIVIEEKIMWVYRQLSESKFSVGYYSPQTREWVEDQSLPSKNEARDLVHWLNGGNR